MAPHPRRQAATAAMLALVLCMGSAVRAQPPAPQPKFAIGLPTLDLPAILDAAATGATVTGAVADAGASGAAALADAGKVAAAAGVIGASLPAYGAVQDGLKSKLLNVIKALNSLGVGVTQATAGVKGAIGSALTAPLLATAEKAKAYHNALLGEAGKAVGSGVAAVATATKPWRALTPGALAMDALIANTDGLIAFLQAANKLAPDAKKVLIAPHIAKLKLAGAGLATLKASLAGELPLLSALSDAGGILGVVNSLGGATIDGLLGDAVALISSAIA